ncbi:MAG TPA: pyridoxal phosphate-dependent aminotransferase [Polyangia bacterium]|jgi:aspartate/methionine/tyrosine aminotransferase
MPRAPILSSSARALRESIFSRLAGRLARHGKDGVPLHLGDTHRAPPPGLSLALDASHLRYGAPAGEAGLLDALANKLRAQNRLDWVLPLHLQVTVGATHALAAAARALLDPGDEVIVPAPHWPLITGILTNAGAVPVEVELSQRLYADPSLDAAALLEPALTPRTAAIYLTTPNNPDGKVLGRRHLDELAALARAHDLWVISDEVYEDLAYDEPHLSIASLPGMAERTITVFSLSKSYALAGLRLGYAVAAEAPMRALRKIANHTVYNVPDVLQRAAGALLTDPESAAWLDETRAEYRAARALATSLMKAPHHLPDGATYLFVDLARHADGKDGIWPLVERLLDAGVSVSPGEQFGRAFAHHARLCFTAVPPDRLRLGLERIARVLG